MPGAIAEVVNVGTTPGKEEVVKVWNIFSNTFANAVFIHPLKANSYRSGQQGRESSGVRVPMPSIARFGRLAYPMRGEVTNRDMLGARNHGCPMQINALRWERPGW